MSSGVREAESPDQRNGPDGAGPSAAVSSRHGQNAFCGQGCINPPEFLRIFHLLRPMVGSSNERTFSGSTGNMPLPALSPLIGERYG